VSLPPSLSRLRLWLVVLYVVHIPPPSTQNNAFHFSTMQSGMSCRHLTPFSVPHMPTNGISLRSGGTPRFFFDSLGPTLCSLVEEAVRLLAHSPFFATNQQPPVSDRQRPQVPFSPSTSRLPTPLPVPPNVHEFLYAGTYCLPLR